MHMTLASAMTSDLESQSDPSASLPPPLVPFESLRNPWEDVPSKVAESGDSASDDHGQPSKLVAAPLSLSQISNVGAKPEDANPASIPNILPQDLNFASPSTAENTSTTSELKFKVDRDLLNEFDPLADNEERRAREAWETATSNPPLNPPPETEPPQKSEPAVSKPRPSSLTAAFPTFASIARTFTRSNANTPPPTANLPEKPPTRG